MPGKYDDPYSIKFDREECFALLRERGIKKVILEFSGGNDEGSIDAEEYMGIHDHPLTLQPRAYRSYRVLGGGKYEPTAWKTGGWNPVTKKYHEEELADDHPAVADAILRMVCEAPIYERYSTFAGEFHVSGTLDINVEKETVQMQVSESVEHYENHEYVY